MDKVRLSAQFWTFLEVIPNLAVVVVLLLRRPRRGHRCAHARHAGRLHHPDAVAGLAGRLARLHPGDGAGGDDRSRPDPRDLRHRALIVSGPRVDRGARAVTCASRASASRSPTSRTSRCCTTSTSTSRPGETVAIVGATGSGKTVLTAAGPAALRRHRRPGHVDGVDVRDLDLVNLRQIVATAFEEPTLFSMSARENLHAGPARRERGGRRARRWRSRRPASCTTCPGGWTPGSASRACRSPAVSGSGSRWPARCSPTRGSWCSTTPCPRSTCTPRSSSRRPCAGCCATRPGSWWHTAPRRCCSPTRWHCSRAARSRTSGCTATCWPRCPAYRELLAADAELEELSA